MPGAVIAIGSNTIRLDEGPVRMVEAAGRSSIEGLVAVSPEMRAVTDRVLQLAATNVPVLLNGESGTGKELLARALHRRSSRSEGPFVTVDCGAIPRSLFASELYGHERGAFTGADRRSLGAFERAHGGTLFLDEIGEVPTDVQATLLGALERGEVRRLGADQPTPVDVRVVSATHRDLRSEVNTDAFRLDLYYRLAVVTVRVPPLRERAEGIPRLIDHFLSDMALSGTGARTRSELFSPSEIAELQRHRWPGNVRELRNVVAAKIATGESPSLVALAPSTDRDLIGMVLELPYKEARRAVLNQFESRYVQQALGRSDGNVRKAASEAGMDRSYLTDLLKRHGLR